jgi:hypothetical protein
MPGSMTTSSRMKEPEASRRPEKRVVMSMSRVRPPRMWFAGRLRLAREGRRERPPFFAM